VRDGVELAALVGVSWGVHAAIVMIATVTPRMRRVVEKETPSAADCRRTTGAPVGLSLCRPDPVVKMSAHLVASAGLRSVGPFGDYSVPA